MKLHRCCLALILAPCVLLISSQSARAAAIVGSMQESFSDYTVGTAFTTITPPSTSQNGGSGWNTTGSSAIANDTGASWGAINNNSGVLKTITSPGLTFTSTGYTDGTGNKLTLDANSTNATQNIGRPLGGQTIDTGTTYFSFLMSKNTDTTRTCNFGFFNGTTERFSVGQIGATAGTSNGTIALLMNNSNPAGLIVNTTNPVTMGVGTTHLILGRIDWNASGNETVSIWVDLPDVSTEPSLASAYLTTSGFELTAITNVRPFTGNTSGALTGVSANFDEVRVGDTWTSVVAPVPEPTSIALACVGGLGLLLAARRRGK